MYPAALASYFLKNYQFAAPAPAPCFLAHEWGFAGSAWNMFSHYLLLAHQGLSSFRQWASLREPNIASSGVQIQDVDSNQIT